MSEVLIGIGLIGIVAMWSVMVGFIIGEVIDRCRTCMVSLKRIWSRIAG